MAMELSDLVVFLEVARQGSFSRAAAALGQAQPSVSARMAGLEATVGEQLFVRSTRGVELAAAGRALEPYARRCVALADEGRLAARTSAGLRRLVVSCPASLAPSLYPPLITALADEQIELVCRTAHSHEIVEQLVDGRIALGFLTDIAVPEGVVAKRFGAVPVIAVAPKSHPLVAQPTVRLGDLAGQRLAVHSWGPDAGQLETLLSAVGASPANVCWVSPAATARALAVQHDHVAILPANAVRADLDDGRLLRLSVRDLPSWALQTRVAYRRGNDGGVVGAALRALSH